MLQPYLLRFAVPTPEELTSADNLAYHPTRQLTVVADDAEGTPAVLHPEVPTMGTKKADREKGEDQKDRWR